MNIKISLALLSAAHSASIFIAFTDFICRIFPKCASVANWTFFRPQRMFFSADKFRFARNAAKLRFFAMRIIGKNFFAFQTFISRFVSLTHDVTAFQRAKFDVRFRADRSVSFPAFLASSIRQNTLAGRFSLPTGNPAFGGTKFRRKSFVSFAGKNLSASFTSQINRRMIPCGAAISAHSVTMSDTFFNFKRLLTVFAG